VPLRSSSSKKAFRNTWEPDSARKNCAQCSSEFGLFLRKHHCRSCGKLHCADCLNSFDIPNAAITVPKICKSCYPSFDKMTGAPAKGPVPAGLLRICVAGYGASPHYSRANNVALLLVDEFPDKFEFWTYAPSRDDFFVWLEGFKENLPKDSPFQKHKTSPLCWFEKEDGAVEVLGGRDRFVEWTANKYPGSKADKKGESFLNPFEATKAAVPPKGPVTAGKVRFCVAGYSASPNFTRAHNCAVLLSQEYPDKYEYWSFGPSRDEFFEWFTKWKLGIPADSPWQNHKTSPICWMERDDGSMDIVGGRDRFVEWTATNHPRSKADKQGEKNT